MMNSGDEQILNVLQEGELTLDGEFLWGSNYTFSVQIVHGETTVQGVYKPTRGERPLWDFPKATLAKREVAAYLVSEALKWRLVPPTVYRKQAPIGPGSVQLYVEHDPEYHYFNFSKEDRRRLRPVVLFDILVNNADRKGSHVLIDPDDHMWLIDHGICFHRESKLRTVIWDFAGDAIPTGLCDDLNRLTSILQPDCEFYQQLQAYLSREEIRAILARARYLMNSGRFPNPHPNRRPYPWPPV